MIEITIADRGPGISAADRERATERFFRAESARSTAGSGLGLALVAAVAQLHNGTLQLARQPSRPAGGYFDAGADEIGRKEVEVEALLFVNRRSKKLFNLDRAGSRATGSKGKSFLRRFFSKKRLNFSLGLNPVLGANAELLQLAVQRAALHADEIRRAADIAAEAQQLRLQILRLEHIARLAQRQRHDIGGGVDGQRARRVGGEFGRQMLGAETPRSRPSA